MSKLLTLSLIIVPFFLFGQRSITGRVVDIKTGKELPFATVQLQNISRGTITNESGYFRIVIPDHYKVDTLMFSYMGYRVKKLSINQIKNDTTIFLEPTSININEFTLVGHTDEYIFNLLNKVFKSYRAGSENYVSKSLLTLVSHNDTTPVEVIEALYNASLTKRDGLNELVLKMGRYGHSRDLQFYSMNTTDLLIEYTLFQADTKKRLPSWPGKMTQRAIKKNFSVKLSQLHENSLVKIDFISKSSAFFSGYVIFNPSQLYITEINLSLNEPKVNSLSPIDATHKMQFAFMELNVKYNPLNKNRPEIINFNYALKYKISKTEYKINTNCNLHFFDYSESFLNPVYTSNPLFLNDYERIVGNGFDEKFWNNNYNQPFSNSSTRLLTHFEDIGITINFNYETPSIFFDYFSFPLVFWDSEKRIIWKHFTEGSKHGKKDKHSAEAINKVVYSDMYKADIGFFFNPLENNLIIDTVISYAYFNQRSSYFFPKPEGQPLTLFNILFDYYHIKTEEFTHSFSATNPADFSQKISLLQKDCSDFEKDIVVRTNLGKNVLRLQEYNDELAKTTNIDNMSIKDLAPIVNKERNIHDLGGKYYLEVANELFIKKDYANSLIFYDKAENVSKTKELQVAVNYNRALLYIDIKDYPKAIFYLKKNVPLNDSSSIELLKTIDDNSE